MRPLLICWMIRFSAALLILAAVCIHPLLANQASESRDEISTSKPKRPAIIKHINQHMAAEYGRSLADYINRCTPMDGDNVIKISAHEKLGTEWQLEMAYGYWGSKHNYDLAHNEANIFLIHARLTQQLIEDEKDGGTFLRVKMTGSVGLDKKTRHSEPNFIQSIGSASSIHGDYFGPHDFALPEVSIMQYFDRKKHLIIAGVVDLSNYFDIVGIANNSFSGFTNGGFCNSRVLPIIDSNFGAIYQYAISDNQHSMIAITRTHNYKGGNPFRSGRGMAIVGEWSQRFNNERSIIRLNPFYRGVEGSKDGHSCTRGNWGLTSSAEYDPTDNICLYMRTGWGAREELGFKSELSFGTQFRLFKSRPRDYAGAAFGFFKGQDNEENPRVNSWEKPIELIYIFQVNDYIRITPHFQYIFDTAYSGRSEEMVWGIQSVFMF